MNMKKISAVILALVMALSLTATAFAATVNVEFAANETTKTSSQTIQGSYTVPTGKVVDAYRVDITWNAMKFTFNMADNTNTYTWNPETLQYESSGTAATGSWTSDTNEFKLENRSSKEVGVTAATKAEKAAAGVTAAVTIENQTVTSSSAYTLPSAVGYTGNGPVANGKVVLDGTPDLTTALTDEPLFTLTLTLTHN